MAQSLSSPSIGACLNPRNTVMHCRSAALDALTSSCFSPRPSSKLTTHSTTKKLLAVKCRQSEYFEEPVPSFSVPQKDPSLPRPNRIPSPTAGPDVFRLVNSTTANSSASADYEWRS